MGRTAVALAGELQRDLFQGKVCPRCGRDVSAEQDDLGLDLQVLAAYAQDERVDDFCAGVDCWLGKCGRRP